jgi:hypothetical protein
VRGCEAVILSPWCLPDISCRVQALFHFWLSFLCSKVSTRLDAAKQSSAAAQVACQAEPSAYPRDMPPVYQMDARCLQQALPHVCELLRLLALHTVIVSHCSVEANSVTESSCPPLSIPTPLGLHVPWRMLSSALPLVVHMSLPCHHFEQGLPTIP